MVVCLSVCLSVRVSVIHASIRFGAKKLLPSHKANLAKPLVSHINSDGRFERDVDQNERNLAINDDQQQQEQPIAC